MKGKGLGKFVETSSCTGATTAVKYTGNRMTEQDVKVDLMKDTTEATLGESDAQKIDFAPVYILTSIRAMSKEAVRKLRCRKEAWNTLKTISHAVSEARIDEELSRLPNVQLKMKEKIVDLPSVHWSWSLNLTERGIWNQKFNRNGLFFVDYGCTFT